MRTSCCFAWVTLAVLAGCGSEIPPEPPAENAPPSPVAAAAASVAPAADTAPAAPAATPLPQDAAASPAVPAGQPPAGQPVTGPELAPPAQAQPAAPPAAATPADMERVKAEKGVGLKGRSLDQYQGVLVTPAKAYFSVRERAVFDIQIPKALKLFEATNGNNPKTHAEFMAQIIEANQIQLPQLPAGQRYVYDPEKEELMVERPR